MEYPQINFNLKLASQDSIETIAKRTGDALQCKFSVYEGDWYDEEIVMEAHFFGLWLQISAIEEETGKFYYLSGEVSQEIDSMWEEEYETIDISAYILGLLRKVDSEHWELTETSDEE